MSNSLGTKLSLRIKLVSLEKSWTWLKLAQTLRALTTFYTSYFYLFLSLQSENLNA